MLRRLSMSLTVVSAVLCVALMLLFGRRNPSALVMVFFVVWVLAPFVGLGVLQSRSAGWTPRAQSVLAVVALLISAVSIGVYAVVAFGPPRPQPARFFLMVPTASLVVIAAVAFGTRKR